MIRALRNMDRLYFGPRYPPSAINMAVCLLTGFTPVAFAMKYLRGEFDDEVTRLCK